MDREEVLAKAGKFKIEALFLLLAYVVMFISASVSIRTGDASWFARSGSIAVLISAIIEFRNYSVQQKLNEIAQESSAYWGAKPEKWKVPVGRKIFDKTVLFTVVLGTVVWGYGDLFFKYT
jgi:hypothetical protein